MWVTVSGKGLLDTLVGVVYVPPRLGRDVEVKGKVLIDFILEKQREGLKVNG